MGEDAFRLMAVLMGLRSYVELSQFVKNSDIYLSGHGLRVLPTPLGNLIGALGE